MYDKEIAKLRADEVELNRSKTTLQASMAQLESVKNAKYKHILDDLAEQIKGLEEKAKLLYMGRLKAKDNVDMVNRYYGEGNRRRN